MMYYHCNGRYQAEDSQCVIWRGAYRRLGDRFLASKTFVERYIELYLQYGTLQTITEQKQALRINQYDKLLVNSTLSNALLTKCLHQPSTTRDWFCCYIDDDCTWQFTNRT